MKIGRNDACPCGSGKKYKRCCADPSAKGSAKRKIQSGTEKKVTLGGMITQFQELARQKKEMVQQVGVFLLYSDCNGDAWVLEITDSDCIQIAAGGNGIEVPLEETEETITVDWSHTFSFKNKQLEIWSYREKNTEILEDAPSQQLFAARRKILKRLSPELLDQMHLEG
jgi:hypothetical protein